MSGLLERDKKSVWHPFTWPSAPEALPVTHGSGTEIFTEDGTAYLDATSSWWVTIHGHAHPYISQKLREQLDLLHQVIFAGCTHEPAVKLAERLLSVLPNNQKRIFFSDNGSTSVEVGLKMAYQFWKNKKQNRRRIVAFEGGYHGDTFGAMSVSSRGQFVEAFSELLFDVEYIPSPSIAPKECLAALKKVLSQDNETAAIIIEPLLQAAGGMLMYSQEVLDEIFSICKEASVLIIADEVMTGFLRTGNFFASTECCNQPDIICLSKGLTGGTLALGVTSCTQNIFDVFAEGDKNTAFLHGHSFTANPLACTAALASLDLLENPECAERIKQITKLHHTAVAALKKCPHAYDPRALGTVLAFNLSSSTGSYQSSLRDIVYKKALLKNILLRPLGNVVYTVPPYCITDKQLQTLYEFFYELCQS